ncbi:DUF4288 domain-containing protein [Lysobacter sp. 5GHs7-4]|uniref:DUF4288 domain-containing protein n=1 Tax=Lysobacter sp. 5GHs7-4 TaxID=2904253 RepID=UPI001E311E92|nr:DUF4288 domain-containing protein [Lysobacter sp. 5GHs7-4]UHQ23341.1 DUF4288 domain-containing protein [Lysobacter sp. 5GHs7-4]
MSKTKESGKTRAPEVEAGERFAAKLLFQFRVMVDGDPGVMRTCEERIIVFRAMTARKALAHAKRRGRSAKHRYRNSYGNAVHFEFVGVLDLMHLGGECDDDEVWYDITRRKLPMERAANLIPPDHELSAIRLGI